MEGFLTEGRGGRGWRGFEQKVVKVAKDGVGWGLNRRERREVRAGVVGEFFLTGDKEEEGVGSVFFWEAGFCGRIGVDGLWRF